MTEADAARRAAEGRRKSAGTASATTTRGLSWLWPRHNGARCLLVILLALGFATAALELSLRLVGGLGTRIQAIPDPRVGWRLIPGQRRMHLHDPSIPETINDWGFRDRDWGPIDERAGAPGDALRVAVLGNSLTDGTGVRDEQTWPRRLEHRLADALRARGVERDVVVMNFALPAFTVEQSMRLLEDIASQWNPELVILSLHPVDMLPMRPVVDSRTTALPNWILRTAIFEWLANDVFDFRPGARRDARIAAWQEQLNAMLKNPFAAKHRGTWQRSGQLIQAARRSIEEQGGHLMVCMLPITQYWSAPHWPSPMTYFDHWIDAQRHEHPDTSVVVFDPTADFIAAQGPLTQLIQERGFLTSDRNTPSIGADWPNAGLSLYLLDDFGHFSVSGHDRLAALVFQQIMKAQTL